MTVFRSYNLNCTRCSYGFCDNGETHYDTEEEVKESALRKGWYVDVKVQNGSFWDFCPKCVDKNKVRHDDTRKVTKTNLF